MMLYLPIQLGAGLLWLGLASGRVSGRRLLLVRLSALLCLAGSLAGAVLAYGAELGVTWWLMMFCLAMAVAGCLEWLLNRRPLRYPAAPVASGAEPGPAASGWFATALAWLRWTWVALLAMLSALLCCAAIAAVWPGKAGNVLSFAGLLFPLLAMALFLAASTHASRRAGLLWMLAPAPPALMVILGGFVL